MVRRFLLIPIFLVVLLKGQSFGQETGSVGEAFKLFLNDPALKDASTGFCIMDARSGGTIFSYNDSMALVPASCLKIATTGAALGLMGDDHKFLTKIFYHGNIGADGTLHGDIIIDGGGDPTLGSERWGGNHTMFSAVEEIRKKIMLSGIKKIDGKLILDISRFDNKYCCHSWAIDDTGNYFGAGACAFNIGENKYGITLQAGIRRGSAVRILSYTPEQLHLHFDNHLTTGGPHTGDQSNIYIGVNDSTMNLEGTIQSSKYPFTIKGAIPNPPEFAANYIAADLYQNGLLQKRTDWQINCGGTDYSTEALKVIDSIQSPYLIDIVHYTNLNSINLYAECILKETGKVINGFGTRLSGITAVKKYWHDNGVDTSGLYMVDGCGLARSDKITAFQLCGMLSVMATKPYFPQFLGSLPVAGESGAMRDMGKGTVIQGKLYCKTGHIDGIRSYSGYFKNRSGKWICFSLMVNNYNVSSIQIFNAIEKLMVNLERSED